jgi:hypothetical protein
MFTKYANTITARTTADAGTLFLNEGIMTFITSEQTAFVRIPVMRVITPELSYP